MNGVRAGALVVGLLGLTGLVSSVGLMASRVAEHNRQNRKVYFFREVTTRDFEFGGKPVRVSDEDPGGTRWHVNVAFADDVIRLRVPIPGNPKLPDMVPYNDWLRILLFAESRGLTAAELAEKVRSGEIPARLVLVARTPMPGAPQGEWQDVWRSGWAYDFFEFKREGGFIRERYTFPSGKPERGTKPGQIPADSWQLQAAASVTPQKQRPNNRFTMDALNAAGWTLPAAAWSSMMLLAAVGVGLAPRRTRTA